MYMDEQSKQDIKDILVQFDRSLLVTDPRRNEPKKPRSFSDAAPGPDSRSVAYCAVRCSA